MTICTQDVAFGNFFEKLVSWHFTGNGRLYLHDFHRGIAVMKMQTSRMAFGAFRAFRLHVINEDTSPCSCASLSNAFSFSVGLNVSQSSCDSFSIFLFHIYSILPLWWRVNVKVTPRESSQ